MSDTNGVNTALKLVKTGVTGLTADITAATWNGTTFAAGKAPPTSNTTPGKLAPGIYYTNFTETNGVGETTVSAESATFTLTAQTTPAAQATGAGSSSGSTLPPGAYLIAYTYVDAYGNETTLGSSESATVTTTGTQILTVTFNDTFPTWSVGRNVYLTAVGGLTTTETLYATLVTTTTYVAQNALWNNNTVAQSAARGLPTVNTCSPSFPQVTFPALQSGNTARNLYLSPPGGATGTEVLYASGITGLTFDCVNAAPSAGVGGSYAVIPPTSNGTGLNGTKLSLFRSCKTGNLEDVYRAFRTDVANFNRGDPMPYQMVVTKLRDIGLVWAMLAQASAEIGHWSTPTRARWRRK